MELAVIDHTHGRCLGKLEATEGMMTTHGEVIKVNPKSVLIKRSWGTEERTTEAKLEYKEAIKHGFPKVENHDQEIRADIETWFNLGMAEYTGDSYEVDMRHQPEFIVNNPAVKAGWKFAQSTAALKEMIIDGLV